MGNNDLIILTVCSIAFVQYDLDGMWSDEWEQLKGRLVHLMEAGTTEDLIKLYNYIENLDNKNVDTAVAVRLFHFSLDLGDYLVYVRKAAYGQNGFE